MRITLTALALVGLLVVFGVIARSAALQHPAPRTPATIETVTP